MHENTDVNQGKPEEFIPASLVKRAIAFGMDAILLFILLQLVALLIPNFYDESSQKEFNRLVYEVSLLRNDEQFDSANMAKFIQESKLSEQTYGMLIGMLITSLIIPISYFFVGESFFKGQTLGKATFGLRTVLKDNFEHPSMGKILLRSVIKSFASISLITPFMLPGFLNFASVYLTEKKDVFMIFFPILLLFNPPIKKVKIMNEIAFIGAGKMVSAIVKSLLKSGVYKSEDISCCSAKDGTSEKLSKDTGIIRKENIHDLLSLIPKLLF